MIGRRRVRPIDVTESCQEVVDNPSYCDRARAIQREILALPPLGHLLDDIEALASEPSRRMAVPAGMTP
jgi:hypothetical protein